MVLAQVRPTTTQTVYRSDWVGSVVTADRAAGGRPGAHATASSSTASCWCRRSRSGCGCSASRCAGEGRTIAVLTKESTPTFGRQPGELERTYVEVFNRFARMIAAGQFPFEREDTDTDALPRVGDGVVVLDAQMRVEYSSPNGVSALHRIGIHANAEGMRLGELGLDETPDPRRLRRARCRSPRRSSAGPRSPSSCGASRCSTDGTVTGAVVLLRDISELRRRDRLLLSKDATIREIHHRVKNNLQTISSLLRLQGRRLESPEAKAAIEESVRRIRSIALVHEILSREAGEDVPFLEIVRDLTRMVEEAFAVPERPVRCTVDGDPGVVPADGGDAAGGRAQRAAAERRRPRLPGRRRRRDGGARAPPRRRASSSSRWSTTAWGCPRASTLERATRARPVDRADARAAPSSTGRSSWLRRRRPAGAGGPWPTIRVPVVTRRCDRRQVGSGGVALAGDPGPAELAALLLGGAAPDAGVLVGGEGELEAGRPAPRRCGRRPWPARSARWRGRWCPTGKNRSGLVSRQAA